MGVRPTFTCARNVVIFPFLFLLATAFAQALSSVLVRDRHAKIPNGINAFADSSSYGRYLVTSEALTAELSLGVLYTFAS